MEKSTIWARTLFWSARKITNYMYQKLKKSQCLPLLPSLQTIMSGEIILKLLIIPIQEQQYCRVTTILKLCVRDIKYVMTLIW